MGGVKASLLGGSRDAMGRGQPSRIPLRDPEYTISLGTVVRNRPAVSAQR